MDEETWKKGEELIKVTRNLKADNKIEWVDDGAGDEFRLLCELLKGNALPTKRLSLGGDLKNQQY